MKEATKDEIKQMIHDYIKQNLKLEITSSVGGFTDPNGRNFVLKLGKEVINSQYFHITVRNEYER